MVPGLKSMKPVSLLTDHFYSIFVCVSSVIEAIRVYDVSTVNGNLNCFTCTYITPVWISSSSLYQDLIRASVHVSKP